ncbi:hypothetical protein C8R43DRAFT_940769 [Mycena crocata]|nr:hypothetical protein C8R43DRAFT_940769 [Mycena crocata]
MPHPTGRSNRAEALSGTTVTIARALTRDLTGAGTPTPRLGTRSTNTATVAATDKATPHKQQVYAQRQQNNPHNDNYRGRSFEPRGWAARGNAGYNRHEATRGAQQRRYSLVASANRGTTRLRAANTTDMVPFTPKPPPSLADAERDARGHPLFPLPDNVSEYLGSDDSSESAAVAAKSLCASEMVRITKLGPRTEPPAPVPENAAAVGVWHGLTVQSTPDGRNMLQWNDAGCPFTRAKVLHLIAHWKARPPERRPAGITYLMSQESTSRERFLLATTGKPFEKKRKSKAAIASASGPTTGASAQSGPSSASAQLEEDSEMPAVPPAVETVAPYLGLSPSGNDVGVVNSCTLLSDAVEHWAKIPTKDWYAGMRGEYPRKEYERPDVRDVRSVMSLAVFIANPGFEETSLTMFSCAGMFARFVHKGAYKLALRGPERFEFETKDCGWSEAAAWWMCHGLSPVSEDTQIIESFACSWRNRLAGGEIPGNIIFTEYPTDPGCTSTLSSADIVPWNMLVFPKLVDGRTSSFPQDVSSASAEVLPLGPILDEDDSMGVEKED